MAMNVNMPITPPTEDGGGNLDPLYELLQKITVDNSEMRDSIQTLRNDFEIPNTIYTELLDLEERKNHLITNLANILCRYDFIQNEVIKALKLWLRQQALSANGGQYPKNLDTIQYYVMSLLDCITQFLIDAQSLLYIGGGENLDLNEILKHANTLRNVLVRSSFIVEKQPMQVIKKSSRFGVTLRWLIGDKLNIYQSRPIVKCEILSEAQAKRLASTSNTNISNPPTNGEMTGNEVQMEYDANNRIFSANFTNLIIKHIQRSERKGPEIVMDEKCTLLFYTITGYESYRISCWTITLPLVVVVHGSQGPQSLATITWDNAFSIIEREPFQVPNQVHYTKLLDALNMKFTFCTGRSLTLENYEFLREKLIIHKDAGQFNEYITYSQFCRDKLPDRGFTFWEWFYATMKLTEDHLKEMWMRGLIVGFINKIETSNHLLAQENGTFLLRFSDSELGGITIAFRDDSGFIRIIAPWNGHDLQTRCLGDRIRDLDLLMFVYPTMLQRDAAFGSFYTPQPGQPENI